MLIDTNILLRYILQDHADLSSQATQIIVENKAVCLNEVDCLLIAHQSLYQTKIKSFDKKMNRYLDTMSS